MENSMSAHIHLHEDAPLLECVTQGYEAGKGYAASQYPVIHIGSMTVFPKRAHVETLHASLGAWLEQNPIAVEGGA